MLSGLSVAPPDTAHKLTAAIVVENASTPVVRPCLALVPAGFFPPVPPPPIRVEVTTYWHNKHGDLAYITCHLQAGRAVAARCHWTWCLFVAHHIGSQMSEGLARAGIPHQVEMYIDRDGFKTLVFIPEKK